MCNKVSIDQNGESRKCNYAKLVDIDLPIDDSGLCIFHSENIEWKKAK